jgi:excisionase family DNA binding protein
MKQNKPLFSANDYRKIITLSQLEETTGIKKSTLRIWLRDNRIPGAFRAGRGTRWQFNRDALEEWWQDMQQKEKPRRA